jgi:hypothetical protein
MAYVNIDIELEDFDDDDLIEEVKSRGFHVFEDYDATSTDEDLEQIYLLRRRGLPYDHLMDAYIYKILGKVI